MGIISWIIVGIAAGWLARIVTGTRRNLVGNLVLGSIGALVAGWITHNLVRGDAGLISSIIVAAIAAAIIVAVANIIAGRW